MTSIEQTGRDIEEATQLALEQLGVTEDEVDVEILEEGSRGFLGLGQAPAMVRVTLKERAEKPSRRAAGPRERKPAERKAEATKPVEQVEPVTESPRVETPEPEAPAPTAAAPQKGLAEQAAEISRDMLQHILEGMGDKAEVIVKSTEDDQVVLDIVGGDTAVIIGKHGQTLNALQYLLGIATNKRLPEKVRIILDAEGYRGRREETLRSQALFLAAKVKESGEEAVLEPLEANERRVVHLALADDPDVHTYSEGADSDRHVVISPKK